MYALLKIVKNGAYIYVTSIPGVEKLKNQRHEKNLRCVNFSRTSQ